jgi:ATP-dependent protease ClpP protease subunit
VVILLLSFMFQGYAMSGPPVSGKFDSSNYCYLVEQVNKETVDAVLECLNANKSSKLFLDSPGGLVHEGVRIIEFVKDNNTAVLCKRCYSMAAIIFLNAKNKEIFEDSQVMMHYIWTIICGGVRIKDLRDLADKLEKDSEELIPEDGTVMKKYIISKMKKGDFFFGKKTLDVLNVRYRLLEE